MPSRSLSSDIKVGGAGVTVASSPWPFLVSWFSHPFWIKCRKKKSIDGRLLHSFVFFFNKNVKQVNLRKSTDPAGVYFCSGSLISSRHVLLAAQCLERCRSFINLSLIWLRY
jgi:hypothetical protein